jgi:hypothetical protein
MTQLINSLATLVLTACQHITKSSYKTSDVPKTAFTCHIGSFEWRVLTFGLTNAPSTFSRTMS